MGTEIHYRSYYPGHDKMRDLNADARNSWPSFYINKTFNEQLYNGCFPSSLNGYSEYDKEMLKQRMLEHEAIFRKQVYELHRLYGIQKDLMEEFQKNGLSGISEHKVPSKTLLYSSQAQADHATRIRRMSHLCAMNNSSQKMEKPRYNDDNIYSLNFLESNMQSSPGCIESETLQRVFESDSSFRKCPKRKLDFQLPAEAYIDDTERSEEIPGSSINTSTCSRICTGDSEIEVKLNLVSVSGSSGKEDICKLNFLHNKSLFTGLADLNEPNRQTFLEGEPNSFPVKIFGPKNQTKENYKLNFPLRSTTLSLQNTFSKDGNYGELTFSNVCQGANEEISRGAVCNNDAGKLFPKSLMNSTSLKEKNPMLCEPVHLTVNKVSDIISVDHNEASTWLGHEQGNHFLVGGKWPGQSESGNLANITSVLPSSFKLESNMTSLPLVPTWLKLASDENHASSPFSAISGFDGFSRVKNIGSSDIDSKDPKGSSVRSLVGIDLKSPLRFEEKSSSHLNVLNDGLQLQSRSTLQIKFQSTNINLNDEAEKSLSVTHNGPNAQQNKATKDIDAKCEKHLPGLSWLKRRQSYESLELSKLPSQVDLGFSQMNRVYDKKTENATSLSSCNFEVFSSSLHARETEIQNNLPTDCLSSTKFIAPNFDKLQQNLLSSNQEKLIIDELKHVSISHDIKMYSSQKSISKENNRKNFKSCIDLNSVFPFVEDPDSSDSSAEVQEDPDSSDSSAEVQEDPDSFDSSAEVQEDVPSIHSDPILFSRVVPSIDLEAPVMSTHEDNITFDIASTRLTCRDGLKEELCSHEMVIQEAAENIVKLSSDGFNHKHEIQSSSSTTRADNVLYVFAEMILSNNNITELNTVGDCCLQPQDDGLDLFEITTLQLEELKPEKLWCEPKDEENWEVNEKSKASLLLAKPRRAQGKKRRQKKDFQKDILPALAKLSRQESMGDLQAIGELMKASGMPWQAGIRRRNLRRNSTQAQARRKPCKNNAAVSRTVTDISPPTTLFMVEGNNYKSELEVDRHHMIGWGRTTRRCRSQRCPSVSIPAL